MTIDSNFLAENQPDILSSSVTPQEKHSNFIAIMDQAIKEGVNLGLMDRESMLQHVMRAALPYDSCKENYLGQFDVDSHDLWHEEDAKAKILSKQPRGTWLLLHYVHNGKPYWKALISDGSENCSHVGNLSAFQYKPTFLFVHLNLVAGEVYRMWASLASQMELDQACRVIQSRGIYAGTVMKNISVPGMKEFSKVEVTSVDHSSGVVHMIGNYRGSNRRYPAAVLASKITFGRS